MQVRLDRTNCYEIENWCNAIHRLSTINNDTFDGFPELSRLNLAGNRLTTIFQKDFFHANPFLTGIWLGDNPWICDCYDGETLEFYRYLTEYPARVCQFDGWDDWITFHTIHFLISDHGSRPDAMQQSTRKLRQTVGGRMLRNMEYNEG